MFKKAIIHQAIMNLGTIGHVAHGKSTLVKALTGVQTVRFKNELERNITIKLGYANSKIYKCKNVHCPGPGCFKSTGSKRKSTPFCDQCHSDMILLKHFSFIDCPGHEILMATMLNGTSIMDGALLIIGVNETCPQPQTSEHLAAVKIMNLKNILILQNKVDLVSKAKALLNYQEIKKFIQKSYLENSVIIPISAQRKVNIEILMEFLVRLITFPSRFFRKSPFLLIVRSFDINKPGCKIDFLQGGVLGGTIIKGILCIGEKIEIRPGITTKTKKGEIICQPIKTLICSLSAEKNPLKYAIPGGLIGIGTKIDPTLTQGDRLSGQILGHKNSLPGVFVNIFVFYKLFKRLLGISKSNQSIHLIQLNEILMINIGNSSAGGKVLKKKENIIEICLTNPICCNLGDRIALSRRIEKHWRLIGWGIIKKGKKFCLPT
ncbi:eif2G (nucleomorph) [Hemiselmis andersenii]|uniref:protein-synthesizing GTPase n=1 Tax=Hemiselmis andersenii TaxID=464988 RepID=A9BL21_HEMAN|nr:eif2G [Hemiselmis andersenii]ABW98204.1 eif2G [Hemiselmis andersenii]|mmetsp:Transcript_29692/g.69378  ORF Transcript_29692/g.69378 Transcript_29692/m.69378 type:complete len:434 (-) Transcript_29692:1269-2570(-)